MRENNQQGTLMLLFVLFFSLYILQCDVTKFNWEGKFFFSNLKSARVSMDIDQQLCVEL